MGHVSDDNGNGSADVTMSATADERRAESRPRILDAADLSKTFDSLVEKSPTRARKKKRFERVSYLVYYYCERETRFKYSASALYLSVAKVI